MNTVGIALTLISVLCAAGPVAGLVITYQSNPVGMVVPPQVSDIVGNGFSSLSNFSMPQIVSSDYNETANTAILVFNVTNSVSINCTLKDAYAEVRSHDDQTFLANATLLNPVFMPGGQAVNVTITCVWTPEAETYFESQHAGASSINVDLTQLTINVNDVIVTLSQPIEISNVPIAA